jgi:hypothetical protein
MRFGQYVRESLAEAIQNEPRNIVLFHAAAVKELKKWPSMVEGMHDAFDSKIAEEFLSQAFGYEVVRDFDFGYFANNAKKVVDEVIQAASWYGTLESNQDVHRFVQMALHGLRYWEPLREAILRNEMEEILSDDAAPVTTVPAYEDYQRHAPEDLPVVDRAMSALSNIIPLYRAMKKFFEVDVPKFQEYAKAHREMMFRGKYEPHREDIEVLYHATTNKSSLLKRGFQSERRPDVIGLGELGGARNATVSFTHDLHVAREIARSIKEVWMIAHGKLTRTQILRWLESDGVDVRQANEHVRLAMSSDADPESGEGVFRLYNYWLWVSKQNVRTNPVYGDGSGEKLLKYLKTIPQSEIGVVSAAVRLAPDQYTYHRAEKEYRVSPEHITDVKDVG